MTSRWYAVHAYSNFENKVAESIREQAKQRGLSELFEEILVPKEKVVEVRRGRKVDAERKFALGYALFQMELTAQALTLIPRLRKQAETAVQCRSGSHHPGTTGRHPTPRAVGPPRSRRARSPLRRTIP